MTSSVLGRSASTSVLSFSLPPDCKIHILELISKLFRIQMGRVGKIALHPFKNADVLGQISSLLSGAGVKGAAPRTK